MIKRLVGWFLLLPLAAVLVLFALANRHPVRVGLDPFGREPALLPSMDVPLFVVIYACLIIGILMGGLAVWLTQGHYRRDRRRFRREAERLDRENTELRRQQPQRQGLTPTDELLELE